MREALLLAELGALREAVPHLTAQLRVQEGASLEELGRAEAKRSRLEGALALARGEG